MITSWNDAEDEALMYLPLAARVLYLQGLKRFMDYDTGVVGVRRHISRQGLIETLEVNRDRGSTLPAERPTVKALRVALAQLEKAGLILPTPKQDQRDPMAFFLPLASIRPNEEGPRKGRAGRAEENGEAVRPSDEGGAEEWPSRKGRHQYINNHRTVPYHARVDSDVPAHQAEWAEFMVSEKGFSFHLVQSVPVVQMFVGWVAEGVSVGDARMAMQAAEAKIERLPDNPAFYRNFVKQVLQEKQRGEEVGHATGGGSGARGRKLSPGERAAEQERSLG